MSRNYNQYDDDDYIYYDANDTSYDSDFVYEDGSNDFQNIDPVEYSNYSDDDYTYEDDTDELYEDSEYKERNPLFENRTKIVTGILIVMVLFLAVWLTPQFISRNKKSSSEITLTKSTNVENDITKLKQSALKYYEEGKVPTDVSENTKLTLNELLSEKIVKNFNSSYDKKKIIY